MSSGSPFATRTKDDADGVGEEKKCAVDAEPWGLPLRFLPTEHLPRRGKHYPSPNGWPWGGPRQRPTMAAHLLSRAMPPLAPERRAHFSRVRHDVVVSLWSSRSAPWPRVSGDGRSPSSSLPFRVRREVEGGRTGTVGLNFFTDRPHL